MELSDIDILRMPLKTAWFRQVLINHGIMRMDAADLTGYGFAVPDGGRSIMVNVTEMDEGETAVYAYDGEDWESSVEIPAGTWSEVFGQICMAIDMLLDEYAALDRKGDEAYIVEERF